MSLREEEAVVRGIPKGARVYVLFGNSLMAEGVEVMLKKEGLGVVGVDVGDEEAFSRFERDFQPGDAVIVDVGDAAVHPTLSLLHTLAERADVLVIGLDASQNEVHIFRKWRKTVSQVGELVEAIRTA